MKNNELNMETLKQINGGAADDLSEVKKLDRSELERAPLRELEELLKKAV